MLSSTFVTRMSRRAAQRTRVIAAHMMSSAAADSAPVTFESRGVMRVFNLNRPTKLNALNEEMLDLIKPKIQAWHDSDVVGIICSRGEGRAYCSGGDIMSVVENAQKPETREHSVRFFKKEFELDYMLATLPKPYVAIMDRVTMGGGVGLSAPAHFRIATEDTIWSMPEANIGYTPDVGATYYLNHLDGQIGTYLALTAAQIKGRHVMELGLATHFIPARRIPMLLDALGGIEGIVEDSENPDSEQVVDDTESLLPEARGAGFLDALTAENGEQYHQAVADVLKQYSSDREADEHPTPLRGIVRVALDKAFSHDTVEEIVADLAIFAKSQNSQVSEWATETLALINIRSPTSLKVSLRALRLSRQKNLDLLPALQSELEVSHAYCLGATPDFTEGVTKVLKGKNKIPPVWSPEKIEDVTEEHLSRFFDPESEFRAGAPTLEFTKKQYEALRQSEHSYHDWGLPTEDDIAMVVTGSHTGSPGLSHTKQEVLELFSGWYDERAEVLEKVMEVLDRRCELVANEDDNPVWLSWKHDVNGPLVFPSAEDSIQSADKTVLKKEEIENNEKVKDTAEEDSSKREGDGDKSADKL